MAMLDTVEQVNFYMSEILANRHIKMFCVKVPNQQAIAYQYTLSKGRRHWSFMLVEPFDVVVKESRHSFYNSFIILATKQLEREWAESDGI